MPKDLTKQEDVDASLESQESISTGNLKIPEGKTPVYFLTSGYEDGFTHWIDLPEGRMRVVCAGGPKGRGYAPDDCKICAYCSAMYAKAKKIASDGDVDKAEKIKKLGNGAHARYEAQFIVAKGEMVKVKVDGEKKEVADFDDAEVGILQFTENQYKSFIGLVDKEGSVKTTADLFNRAILLDKAKREHKGKKAQFPTIEFKASRTQSDPPAVEWKPEDFPIADNFKVDMEQIEKAAAVLMGKGPAKAAKDDFDDDAYEKDEAIDEFAGEEEGLDETGLATEEPENDDFLIDVDDEPAPKAKAPAKKTETKAPAKSDKAPAKKTETKAPAKKHVESEF